MLRRLLPLLLVLSAVSGAAQPRVHTSRPFLDMRDVVGVVGQGEVIDVYWLHTNELVEPVRSKLYRTTVSADGLTRIGTHLVRQFETSVIADVSGEGTNVQLMWKGESQIFASPVVDGALKYPEGKPVLYGDFPRLRCNAVECALVFGTSPIRAAILDGDSNLVSGPFELPEGFHPISVHFSEHGLFFARHTLTALRGALVRRDGSVEYDVQIAGADPRAFLSSSTGVVSRGSDHVVAFVDFAPEPHEVRAVTISADGNVGAPVRLLQAEPHRDLPKNIGVLSLAWNGSRYAFTGYATIGPSFLLPLDANLQATGQAIRDAGSPVAWPHPDGSSFILIWQATRPYLTILKADGSMTPPLDLTPPGPRRRAVR